LALTGEQQAKQLGGETYRLAQRVALVTPKMVWDAILTGKPYPVKGLITLSSNPLVTQANTKLVYQALKSLERCDVALVLIDGFVGSVRRIFRPESYDQDLYFPAETTEGRVHRLDRVAHLYKLHGSVTWKGEKPEVVIPKEGKRRGSIYTVIPEIERRRSSARGTRQERRIMEILPWGIM
jgi:hypothetical protein